MSRHGTAECGAAVCTCVYTGVGESVCVQVCAPVCERKLGQGGGGRQEEKLARGSFQH